ncbi:uncharacterized protein BXZ73DRAFT_79448 [Epithele typhae]|uniref:uncharacterized protein n=1 Tax=Epithele typhae TaxID=378194 RepID=UPI0020076F38|nr:uncharacterized protein BXZ73DRAFT_79448 [Epithele typhae]KAH9923763.1 hypothetical protein BXZ73DRAFT_79448 [Epithele typhae]
MSYSLKLSSSSPEPHSSNVATSMAQLNVADDEQNSFYGTPPLVYDEPICVHHVPPPSAISTKYYTLEAPPPNELAGQPHLIPPIPTATTTHTQTHAPVLPSAPASQRTAPVPLGSHDLPKHRRNKDDPGGSPGQMAQPAALVSEQPRAGPSYHGSPMRESRHAAHLPTDDGAHADSRSSTPNSSYYVPLEAAAWSTPLSGFSELTAALLPPPDYVVHPPNEPHHLYNAGPHFDPAPDAAATRNGTRVAPHERPRTPKTQRRLLPHAHQDAPSTSDWTSAGDGPKTEPNEDTPRARFVYSPTTARRINVSVGSAGLLQLASSELREPAEAKTRHKRLSTTSKACVFCRKRKIACGGPLAGDESRRCGSWHGDAGAVPASVPQRPATAREGGAMSPEVYQAIVRQSEVSRHRSAAQGLRFALTHPTLRFCGMRVLARKQPMSQARARREHSMNALRVMSGVGTDARTPMGRDGRLVLFGTLLLDARMGTLIARFVLISRLRMTARGIELPVSNIGIGQNDTHALGGRRMTQHAGNIKVSARPICMSKPYEKRSVFGSVLSPLE